ncbi:MAG: 50S ribosomal protein L23 [Chlamydiota bacterium]
MEKNPYRIIKSRYVTEKTSVLANLASATSNASVRKCQTPKVVFLVDPKATKHEIAWAVEKIYAKKNVKVLAVNTIYQKGKVRRMRGSVGMTSAVKKAIVTLQPGDNIEEEQG